MRALTLTQPYATLIAIGAKRIETRGWSTTYRGPLAIHAGAGLGPVGGITGLNRLCWSEPFCDVLKPRFHETQPSGWMPRGAIVAVASLVNCVETDPDYWPGSGLTWPIPEPEASFGNYGPGRFAWLLADVRPLAQPVPCKGALSLWQLPPDVLAAVNAQLDGVSS